MKKNDDAPPEMEQPRTGGSFIRQGDGTLKMVEGAIADDEAAPDAAPVTDPAPDAEPPADAGAPVTDQNKG
ncbi:hypothetical protein [Sphingomonas sp. CROZ-RG-20F-R02-07]|uniref:hypothetical protein n=1 Tax=Sphingomonas sp. CROZ-RG-20F-R02-07 TaxID=2914832 RepID=UPI001F566480|nr:hypothetical protein [Sphingomonas sp. CROZ-RG-20F-R02-07]